MAKVRDVMSPRLHTVEPGDTVGEAVAVMAQNRVGSVLIMDGERLHPGPWGMGDFTHVNCYPVST